jgi:hypothetical protein
MEKAYQFYRCHEYGTKTNGEKIITRLKKPANFDEASLHIQL